VDWIANNNLTQANKLFEQNSD